MNNFEKAATISEKEKQLLQINIKAAIRENIWMRRLTLLVYVGGSASGLQDCLFYRVRLRGRYENKMLLRPKQQQSEISAFFGRYFFIGTSFPLNEPIYC